MAHRIVPIQLFIPPPLFFCLCFSVAEKKRAAPPLLKLFNQLRCQCPDQPLNTTKTKSTALVENKGHLLIFTVEKKLITYKNKREREKKINPMRREKVTPSGGEVGCDKEEEKA